MPIYEYECKKCGNSFEELVRSAEESAPKCPQCGDADTVKKLSTFSASMGGAATGGSCTSGGCSTGTCPFS